MRCCAARPAPRSCTPGVRRPSRQPACATCITLDSDTRLPRGAAARLVGTMAHPLNQPAFDDRASRVVDGHAILQPRVTHDPAGGARGIPVPARHRPELRASTPMRPRSRTCTRTCSGRARTPARASTTSTSSSGRSPTDRPENTLLSHDLLEGIFARAGLVTDIEVFDEITVTIRGSRCTSAPMGARGLAAPATGSWAARTARPATRTRSRRSRAGR